MAAIQNPTHAMTWAGISLTADPRIQVLADVDFGAPAPVEEAFPTGLFDGDFVTHTRDGNREIKLRLEVSSTNGVEIAALGESLAAQLYKPTTLVWTPPQGNAPTGVYDVLTSSMVQKFDDVDELHTRRIFELRLVCAPYVRSVDLVTIPALAVGGGSQTVIADGTSATGWTSTTGTVTAGSGFLSTPMLRSYMPVYGAPFGFLSYTTTVTRTMASTNFSTTPYVSVDFPLSVTPSGGTSMPANAEVFAYINGNFGAGYQAVATFPIVTNPGWQRAVFNIPGATSVTSLSIGFNLSYARVPNISGTVTLTFDNVMRSPVVPYSGSNREGIYSLAISGSMRTPGSLTVQSVVGGAGTGNARIVYTCPDLGNGYNPALRPYRTSGGSTSNNQATFSGAYDTWLAAGSEVFTIPAASLPVGGHGIMLALSDSAAAGTPMSFNVTRTIKTFVGATQVGPTDTAVMPVTIGTGARGYIQSNAYTLLSVGGVTLPSNLLGDRSTGTVQITFTQSSGSSLRFDDGFAFFRASNVDPTKRGALTMAVGTLRSYLWLDSPDISNIGRKQVWTGDDPNRGDAFHAGPLTLTWGNHEFAPKTFVFVADVGGGQSGNDPITQTSFTYYPHWHSNAAS
ncbi:MAG: hypothetical protein JWP74_1770 [Marmoricola sp.]|nr:hypothetical protein [Marmoricola sp.]